uniref:CD8+ T-cell target antigen Tp9 n=1 Tax=Theileria parva lawrencei TaxID=1148490 RepID=H9A5L0_THEPA|nr:CD8+ T-cell target antigen Tp9 [Theileria parva lawrencei]
MNVLTTGIILYSFYQCICMDSGDDDDDVFGAAGGSMLPPRQRSPMFSGGLGSSFTSGYTRQELDAKFPGMKKGKGSKDKAPWNNPPQPPKPVKSTLIPGDDVPQGAVGPYGGGYPTQGPYGQPGAGPYGQTGYVGPYGGGYPTQGPYGQPGAGPYGQTGYPTQPGAAGGYPGGYAGQPGASGGYGAGYSGQGGYPPQGYVQPGQGPYPPSGPSGGHGAGAGGYGGGAPGPGQPSGPPGQAPGGNMLKIDAKSPNNGKNIIVEEFRAGRPERTHRQFTPVPGCGINQVNYDGRKVWSLEVGGDHAVKVLVFPIGFKEKTIEITFIGGEKEIYKKKGRNKPWTKQ